MKSRLWYDIHTHSVYSHGKGSIEENAMAAVEAGLKILGISDHGPGHRGYGIDLKKIPEMRKNIAASMEKHRGLLIKLGIEANIINESGELDITKEEQKLFDYIIAGYHMGVIGKSPVKSIATHIGAVWYSVIGGSSTRRVNANTDLVLRALEENRVDVISHPGAKAAFDIDAVARACEKRQCVLEINNRHGFLTPEGIRTAAKYDVKFIMGSDAHIPRDIGRTDLSVKSAKAAGLSPERVINLRKEAAWSL